MSKRNVEGDVLSNRLAVGMAKRQRTLIAMLGPDMKLENADEKLQREQEREELEDESFGPEQLGFGAPIPKNIKDGSFTRRVLTSDDKLLQTLIGKKAAKAHMASKETTKRNATPINFNKAIQPVKTTKPVESDDEDEGRTAAFKSKRQKKRKPHLNITDPDETEPLKDVPDTELPHRSVSRSAGEDQKVDVGAESDLAITHNKDPGEDDSAAENPNPTKSRKSKATKGSYLDELLAERSKKKKNKTRNQEKALS